jgi:hypothetical protein
VFVEAMSEQQAGSSKMKKMKHKFDRIHSLPNCYIVVETTHIIFGSKD